MKTDFFLVSNFVSHHTEVYCHHEEALKIHEDAFARQEGWRVNIQMV